MRPAVVLGNDRRLDERCGGCLKKTTPTSSEKPITQIELHCYLLHLDRGVAERRFYWVWANGEKGRAAAIRVPSRASEDWGEKLESALREQAQAVQLVVAELSRVENKSRQRVI